MRIAQLRSRYPGYSDDEIVSALQSVKYPEYSLEEVAAAVGYNPSDAGRGLKESFQQVPQLAYGALAGVGAAGEAAFGQGGLSTGIKKAGIEGYERWGDKIASKTRPSDDLTYSLEQAKQGDFGALVDWAQHGFGYVLGQGAQALATAGIGSFVGKVGAQQAAKAIASGMVRKEAAAIAEQQAAKAGVEWAALTAAEKAAQASAPAVLQAATAAAASKLGQAAALGAMAMSQEGGEIFGDLTSQNPEQALTGDQLARALGATLAAGGLEFVGDKFGVDLVLGRSNVLRNAAKTRAGRGALGAAAGIPLEGGTEYLQTGIEQYGKGREANILPFNQSEEARNEAFNAAALGALGGGLMGGAGGALTPAKPVVPTQARREQADQAWRDFPHAANVDEAIDKAMAATDIPVLESIEPTAPEPAAMPAATPQPGQIPGAVTPTPQGDLLYTIDGMPYGTRSAAYVRAKREGGDVIPVPGGWAVQKPGDTDAARTASDARPAVADAGRSDRGDGVLEQPGALAADAQPADGADMGGQRADELRPGGDERDAALAPTGGAVMPAGLSVTFGGKTYPVESVEDAQRKWVAFRDQSGGGVSEVGNGVRVLDGAGRFVARISYNGRVWDTEDTPPSRTQPAANQQAPVEMTWTGKMGRGMARQALPEHIGDLKKRHPDLVFTPVPAPEFGENRWKLEGRRKNAAAQAATPAQGTAAVAPASGSVSAGPVAAAPEADRAWIKTVYRMVDPIFGNDIVSQSVQNDGQRVLDAISANDIDKLRTLQKKYAHDAMQDTGGGGAGPGKVRQARRGTVAVFNAATMALENLTPLSKQADPSPPVEAQQGAPDGQELQGQGRRQETLTRRTPIDDPRLKEDDYRSALQYASADIGWHQRGGQLVRSGIAEPAEGNGSGARAGAVVGRTKWLGPDLWRERPDGISEQDAKDAITKALSGEPMSARQKRFVQYVLDREAERVERDRENAAEDKAEREAIMAEASLGDVGMAALDDDDIPFDYRPEAPSGNDQGNAQGQDAREAGGAEEARPGEIRAPDAPGSEEARADEAGLTAPTSESLQAAEDRKAAAEKADKAEQKRLADKARADAERDEFTLTGSNSAADVAAAAGQQDLLAEPAPEREFVGKKMGDFYEVFGDNAREAAKILGLTLTSRNGAPMVGWPYHAHDRNVAALERAGIKFVDAERAEPAKPEPAPRREKTETEVRAVELRKQISALEALKRCLNG